MVIVPKKIPRRNRRKKSPAQIRKLLRKRQRRILDRIANRPGPERDRPMITATNIHYELGERVQGIAAGGIGAMLLLAQRTGLIRDIDHNLHLLKVHLPYHESDHVLNIAFNIVAGGRRLEHIELRRNDEVFLNALGAQRIPDPTTEGDFCRRFNEVHVQTLMDAINETRLRVWAQQPDEFFDEAFVDADGTMVPTGAECKKDVDIDHNGDWGYQTGLISLANIALCRRAGFRRITLRGDTDFSQTKHLDRWDQPGDIRFIFGIDARENLKALARSLPAPAYSVLVRPPKYAIKTEPRQRPERVKEEIVRQRKYETICLLEETVAEFEYRPVACKKSYRVVVLCKRVGIDKGSVRLREEFLYFFYITNDRTTPADQIVFQANDRCDQENLIAQLKTGVHALKAPVNDLASNWAYMVMASLAWSLKAWSALLAPATGPDAESHRAEKRTLLRMEFATYRAAFIEMPCQIIRGARRLIYRLLSWNPWQGMFLRLVERLQSCWLC